MPPTPLPSPAVAEEVPAPLPGPAVAECVRGPPAAPVAEAAMPSAAPARSAAILAEELPDFDE
eukprot:2401381-Pyramimonas_sp.AAC.1